MDYKCTKDGEIARQGESLKVAHHRIDGLEKQSDVLIELVGTVRVIAEQMTSINEKVGINTDGVDENRESIKALREKPLKEYENMKRIFYGVLISAFVSGAIGVLVGTKM